LVGGMDLKGFEWIVCGWEGCLDWWMDGKIWRNLKGLVIKV